MRFLKRLPIPRLAVGFSAAALFLLWIVVNFSRIAFEQNGILRFVLTTCFALLILFRPKKEVEAPEEGRAGLGAPFLRSAGFLAAAAVAGSLLALSGVIVPVRQFEWLGLLLLLFACLKWAFPGRYSRDILLALSLLYFAHPLPNQLFGFLQLGMQRASVRGSEWLLHLLNIRVWADGMVLRTAFNIYDVPEWCSGMRVATTVFLLGLGLGILKRLNPIGCVVVVLAALVQALALNVIRISSMVIFMPEAGQDSGVQFLHDTAGIVVLAGIVLVYFEILLWHHFQAKRKQIRQDLNPEWMKGLSPYPPFWHALSSHIRGILAGVVALAVCAALAYKSRPFHRAEMIKDVATGLRDSGNLEDAQRAAEAVERLAPGDPEWKIEMIRLLVIRGKFEETLAELAKFPGEDQDLRMQKSILEAYALMGLNRPNEAAAIVNKLPEAVRRHDPQVAMILAEMARYANEPDRVAENILEASRWRPNLGRTRSLYPYLRSHRKWDAIAQSDSRIPHTDLAQALSAAEANMNLNRLSAVAEIAMDAARLWPDDPRVLEPLFFMAMRRSDTEWEGRFADHLARSVRAMDNPDSLYALFERCFQISRPDLAQTVFQRIREIDPSHPALPMSAARYGSAWFTFRKRYVGIGAPHAADTVYLRPLLCLLGHVLPSWRSCWNETPFAEMPINGDIAEAKKAFLGLAIEEFRKRHSRGDLSIPMQYEYADGLEMAGDIEGAARLLTKLASDKPEQKNRARIALSEMYERIGDWQNVYESLRDCPASDDPNLRAMVRLCQAQLRLRLGLAALHTARETVRLFPGSTLSAGTLAAVLVNLNSPEEALFALSRPIPRRDRNLDLLEVVLLQKTERFAEAESFCHSVLLPPASLPVDAAQRLSLPPAAVSILWHRVSLPSEREFANNAETLTRNLRSATSPFFLSMIPLWLERYESIKSRGSQPPAMARSEIGNLESEIDKWLACGRDGIEKAIALNQLTLLLCLEERLADARQAAERAARLFPRSPVLWHILIGLSGGDMEIVRAARRECPDDGEIWLAELVMSTQPADPSAHQPPPWNEDSVVRRLLAMNKAEGPSVAREALPRFSPAVVTRAGDYLLRAGMRRAASVAGHDAAARARGLLPAYVLGIRCALADRDKPWAIECTKKAIESSLRPIPDFYMKIMELKLSEGAVETDYDTVAALKYLRERNPDDPLWAQILGYVRFKRGDWEIVDSIHQMTAAIDGGATNRTPYLIGAEASRLVGNYDRAIDLLRKGLKQRPDDLVLLNNLVYTLSLSPGGAVEAMEHVPRLLQRAAGNPNILDTAAVACLHSGQLDQADRILSGILAKAAEGSHPWFRARLHQARIMAERAKAAADPSPARSERRRSANAEAGAILKEILQHSRGIPDQDVIAANNLLADVEAAIQKAREEGRKK